MAKYYGIEHYSTEEPQAVAAFSALQEIRHLNEASYNELYCALAKKTRDDIDRNKVLGLGVGQSKVDKNKFLALIVVFDIDITNENIDFVPVIEQDPKTKEYYIEY